MALTRSFRETITEQLADPDFRRNPALMGGGGGGNL